MNFSSKDTCRMPPMQILGHQAPGIMSQISARAIMPRNLNSNKTVHFSNNVERVPVERFCPVPFIPHHPQQEVIGPPSVALWSVSGIYQQASSIPGVASSVPGFASSIPGFASSIPGVSSHSRIPSGYSFDHCGLSHPTIPAVAPSFAQMASRSYSRSYMSSAKRNVDMVTSSTAADVCKIDKRTRTGSLSNPSQDSNSTRGRRMDWPGSRSSGHQLLNRRWSKLNDVPKRRSQDALPFSLMCYNVLAQNLLRDNMFLYRNCDHRFLEWGYRRSNLINEILGSKSDIVCLQEVQKQHFEEFFMPQMNKKGFVGIYKQRTGNKMDGCAIFYNRKMFKAVAIKPVSYLRKGSHLLDRDNVGVIVLLVTKSGYPPFNLCVATTHLLFNPKRGDIKLSQLAILIAEIDQLCKYKDGGQFMSCPVVLCGDMNSSLQSNLIKFLQEGDLDLTHLEACDISGQSESGRGMKRLLQRPPWPASLGINQRCQYQKVLKAREDAARETEQGRKWQSEESAMSSKERSISRNIIQHPFNFSSVYSLHKSNREVTSNHSRTNCMLDYIFYSSPGKDEHLKSDLPLLEAVGKLDLLTDSEADAQGGLPNQVYSSDHFSLVANFVLTR